MISNFHIIFQKQKNFVKFCTGNFVAALLFCWFWAAGVLASTRLEQCLLLAFPKWNSCLKISDCKFLIAENISDIVTYHFWDGIPYTTYFILFYFNIARCLFFLPENHLKLVPDSRALLCCRVSLFEVKGKKTRIIYREKLVRNWEGIFHIPG